MQQFQQSNVLSKTLILPAHLLRIKESKVAKLCPQNGCTFWNVGYFLPLFYKCVGIDPGILEKIFVKIYECIFTILLSSLHGEG